METTKFVDTISHRKSGKGLLAAAPDRYRIALRRGCRGVRWVHFESLQSELKQMEEADLKDVTGMDKWDDQPRYLTPVTGAEE